MNVANLHFKVTEKDMRELFTEFGKISKITMHYDKNGKPQGTCDIKFAEKTSALKAIKKYNKVPLDSRPMELKLVEDYRPVAAPKPKVIVKQVPVIKKVVVPVKQQKGGNNNLNKRRQLLNKVRQSVTRANRAKNMKNMKKNVAATKSPQKKTPVKKVKKEPVKKVTEEDLDKQLDAYLSA